MSRAVSIRIATSEPVGPDPARHLQTGDVGQADVEHDQFNAIGGFGDVDAVPAGHGRFHDVTVLLEQSAQEADEPRVVLDDQQVHGRSVRLPYGTTVTLEAVPTGPDVSALAVGRPRPPAKSSCTSTVEPVATSAAAPSVLRW